MNALIFLVTNIKNASSEKLRYILEDSTYEKNAYFSANVSQISPEGTTPSIQTDARLSECDNDANCFG